MGQPLFYHESQKFIYSYINDSFFLVKDTNVCNYADETTFYAYNSNLHNSSVIRQKGESQNGCFKKTKHAKFSEKQLFPTP